MIFKATEDQLRVVAALATNASTPIGLGRLHYNPERVFKADDFKTLDVRHGMHLDYVEGRMVKISFYTVPERKDYFRQHTDETDSEYQSWCSVYPTYTDLLKTAGIVPEAE